MKITYKAVSDVGRKRKGNEDSLFVNAEQNLFVVADGMGGHAAGEVASKVAVDAINEFVCLTSGDEEITWPFGLDENISYDGNRLKTAIRFANKKVLEATREKSEYEGMATTVAAVLPSGSRTYSATSAVGHGSTQMVMRKTTFSIRNACVVRSISLNMWWWLTQMIPMVRNETA